MLVNIPAPWSIWVYVIPIRPPVPQLYASQKKAPKLFDRDEFRCTGRWWHLLGGRGAIRKDLRLGSSSTNLSLPNKILNLKKCMAVFLWTAWFRKRLKICSLVQTMFRDASSSKEWSNMFGCIHANGWKHGSARPEPSALETRLQRSAVKSRCGTLGDSFLVLPSALVDGLFQQEHMGIAGLAGRNPSSRAAYNFRPFVCLSYIVWPVFILRACDLSWIALVQN